MFNTLFSPLQKRYNIYFLNYMKTIFFRIPRFLEFLKHLIYFTLLRFFASSSATELNSRDIE